MGRVCYHPCESACNRAVLDSSVGINSVERFLGDLAIKSGWRFKPPAAASGKKVLSNYRKSEEENTCRR
jgi:NADPH-dependent glutamate synthase beta subunit-like oxidoreductase